MTDHTTSGWRNLPLWCLYDMHWVRRFNQAGYRTVGDICDATPEALARNVMGVGPKRAVKLRQTAVAFIESKMPRFYISEPSYDPEVTPTLWDAVATIGSLLVIGALLVLTAWWLM